MLGGLQNSSGIPGGCGTHNTSLGGGSSHNSGGQSGGGGQKLWNLNQNSEFSMTQSLGLTKVGEID